MNNKGQIFTYLFIGIMLIFSLILLALMAKATNPVFAQGATNAGLTGIENIIISNFNIIIFAFGSLALFLLFSIRGGGE